LWSRGRCADLPNRESAKETAFVIADPYDLRAPLTVYEADLSYFKVG
jgi:hypothetical protein